MEIWLARRSTLKLFFLKVVCCGRARYAQRAAANPELSQQILDLLEKEDEDAIVVLARSQGFLTLDELLVAQKAADGNTGNAVGSGTVGLPSGGGGLPSGGGGLPSGRSEDSLEVLRKKAETAELMARISKARENEAQNIASRRKLEYESVQCEIRTREATKTLLGSESSAGSTTPRTRTPFTSPKPKSGLLTDDDVDEDEAAQVAAATGLADAAAAAGLIDDDEAAQVVAATGLADAAAAAGLIDEADV